jgi:hypothetical protein
LSGDAEKQRSYLTFAVCSILACIPLTFYFSFVNTYLNDVERERCGEQDVFGASFGSGGHVGNAADFPAP